MLRTAFLGLPLIALLACSGGENSGGSGGTSGGALPGPSGGPAGTGSATGASTGGGTSTTTGGATGSGGAATGGDTGSGSGGGASDCTPNPAGTRVVTGDVVFDETTCLTWMKTNTSGDGYVAATAYCDALSLGGYDDWRIPHAGEAASIFKCDNTQPLIFSEYVVVGDGFWTTTETGTIAGPDKKVCGAGTSSGMYYDFGPVGGQNTRCVRGTSTIADRPNCKSEAVCL